MVEFSLAMLLSLQAVVKERPEKPLLFMAEWLIKADKAGGGPGTPGKAEKGTATAAPAADAAKAAATDQVLIIAGGLAS